MLGPQRPVGWTPGVGVGGISAAVGERETHIGATGQTSCSWGPWRQEAEMKPQDPDEQSEVWGALLMG